LDVNNTLLRPIPSVSLRISAFTLHF